MVIDPTRIAALQEAVKLAQRASISNSNMTGTFSSTIEATEVTLARAEQFHAFLCPPDPAADPPAPPPLTDGEREQLAELLERSNQEAPA